MGNLCNWHVEGYSWRGSCQLKVQALTFYECCITFTSCVVAFHDYWILSSMLLLAALRFLLGGRKQYKHWNYIKWFVLHEPERALIGQIQISAASLLFSLLGLKLVHHAVIWTVRLLTVFGRDRKRTSSYCLASFLPCCYMHCAAFI